MADQIAKPTRLFNKNFVLLWQGQLVSRLGDQAATIAMTFWLAQITDSASLVGLLVMVSSLIGVVLGPVGATMADRYSRRKLLIGSDLINAVAVLVLAGVLFLRPDDIGLIVSCMFVGSIIAAMCRTVFQPAISAATPDLVPEAKLASANSLEIMGINGAQFVGMALGGTLYRVFGAPVMFFVDGVTFLFSAFNEALVTIPQKTRVHGHGWRDNLREFRAELVDGVKYIGNKPGLAGFVVFAAVSSACFAPLYVLLAFFVEDVLKVSADWYGFISATYAIATVIGYASAGVVNVSGTARATLIILCSLIEAAMFGLLGFTTAEGSLILAFIGGLASGFSVVSVTTILQLSTPSEIRGRVVGLLATIEASLTPLAAGLTGIIADLIGRNIPLIFLGASLLLVLMTLVVALNKNVRMFLSYEKPSEAKETLVEISAGDIC